MGFLSGLFGGNQRNQKLAQWGKSVPVTPEQHKAMSIIWNAVRTKTSPKGNPLDQLSDEDRAYLKHICSSDFRPREFGNADTLRLASFKYMEDLGFSVEEAAVGVGMMFNMVGRDDI